jgi:hypothetical protein
MTLRSVRFLPGGPIHSAWRDRTNQDLLANTRCCYLEFNERTYLVEAGEVKTEGQYPILGITASVVDETPEGVPHCEPMQEILPAVITGITQSDSLGEGATSCYELSLAGPVQFILKHVYPPMTLGVQIV